MIKRYMITDGKRYAVTSTGTIHLAELNSWSDPKMFKEYNTAKKCIEKNETILGKCHVVRVNLIIEVEKQEDCSE